MPVAIKDEFSCIPSRRRRYQLRRAKEGLCLNCGDMKVAGSDRNPLCEKCHELKKVRKVTAAKRIRKGATR